MTLRAEPFRSAVLCLCLLSALIASVGCRASRTKPAVLAGFAGASSALLLERKVSFGERETAFKQRMEALRTRYDTECDPDERKELRNRIMTPILLAILNYHEATADDLYETSTKLETLSDWASIGLTGSVPLVGSKGAKDILGVLATIVTGSRKALEANILAEQTKFAVLINMNAIRMDRLAEILKSMKDDDEAYPLDVGLADLYQFYQSGSIRASVTNLVRQSEQSLHEATLKLNQAVR